MYLYSCHSETEGELVETRGWRLGSGDDEVLR
jgi:hypothetical protein